MHQSVHVFRTKNPGDDVNSHVTPSGWRGAKFRTDGRDTLPALAPEASPCTLTCRTGREAPGVEEHTDACVHVQQLEHATGVSRSHTYYVTMTVSFSLGLTICSLRK